jgi:hypothetical protein
VYRRLVPRLGHNKTIGVIAHRLCLIWIILHNSVPAFFRQCPCFEGLLLPNLAWTQSAWKSILYWQLDDSGNTAKEANTGANDPITSRTGNAVWVGNGGDRALRLDGSSLWPHMPASAFHFAVAHSHYSTVAPCPCGCWRKDLDSNTAGSPAYPASRAREGITRVLD